MPDFRAFTLYVIRHGECEHNVEGWAAGQDDSPLTARGKEQARANGRVLRDAAGDVAALDYFASSLHRTCNTIELLREEADLAPVGFRADWRLMEVNLGDHSRLSVAEVSARETSAEDNWHYLRPN